MGILRFQDNQILITFIDFFFFFPYQTFDKFGMECLLLYVFNMSLLCRYFFQGQWLGGFMNQKG